MTSRAQELLNEPRVAGTRGSFKWYSRTRPIPEVGDIMNVWKADGDFVYMVIYRVAGKERYCGYGLRQRGCSGFTPAQLTSREAFEPDGKRHVLSPKNSLFCVMEILDI